VIEKKIKATPEETLLRELRGVLAPEMCELASKVAPSLLTNEAFERGRAMYHRLTSARGEGDPTVLRAHKDFGLFATAHTLHHSGMTVKEVGAHLQSERVISWLSQLQVPEVLFDNDPLRGERFIKHMSVPKSASPEFAYVLGAHAGTRRLGTRASIMSFTTGEEKLLDRLSAAAHDSCGIVLGRQAGMRNGLERFTAASRAQEFVEYLREVSKENSVVPWQHIHTSAERREFIRGFLDFSGGTLDVGHHRLIIGRRNNPGLLEEVSIVLKREGVLTRVSRGQIPSLHIESYRALAQLRDLHLINACRLREPLQQTLESPPGVQTGRPEHYQAVMEMAERIGRRGPASPEDIRRILKGAGDPAGDLSVDTIRQWVRGGHVPASVLRLREIEALERRIFTRARLPEFGKSITARLEGDVNPRRITNAIAEYVGDVDTLSRQTQVPKRILCEITGGARFPTRAEYRLILDAVGLSLGGELEQGITPPESRDVEQWLKSEAERKVFGSYRAAICVLAREAFQRGEDPREAVRQRLARLMKRNSNMIIDESR